MKQSSVLPLPDSGSSASIETDLPLSTFPIVLEIKSTSFAKYSLEGSNPGRSVGRGEVEDKEFSKLEESESVWDIETSGYNPLFHDADTEDDEKCCDLGNEFDPASLVMSAQGEDSLVMDGKDSCDVIDETLLTAHIRWSEIVPFFKRHSIQPTFRSLLPQ